MMNLYINNSPYKQLSIEDFFTDNVGVISKTLKSKDMDIFNKWSPILKGIINSAYTNDDFMYKFAVYVEVCSYYYNRVQSQMYSSPTIGDLITKIKNNVENSIPERSAILRKVYNYKTNSVEYELEDGNFIQLKDECIPTNLNINNNVFPMEFVKSFDINEYRDMKLNQIL